ncbi:pyridoxal phosphate-dependent aminotransferase family protein [Pontibacter sp. G13]|uniref:aminotransferase class I/II-fold pyridoxal phosphate-dependent enzyme n=1 Tax=Pontibacter sp. G13 TaxID=3074898 RepID=UPI00288C48F3|nr:pyridoxal phosphate-dependent aminotransferase family protein [Pontibacter sp. G13]WNJ18606.1 pyridoxal phosphate-dependent aminotransferase family protein [Pontibacter sp. G13]
MDIFDKIDRNMATDLGQYAAIGDGYLAYPKLEGEVGPWMKFRGKDVLTWSLNSYLGLANHPEIRKVDAQAAADWGLAYPMGSRVLTGNSDIHETFERQAAEFVQKDAAFLLNFGYQGCVSIVHTLTDRRDVIVYDQLSHACIMDGMSISMAKRFVFAHNDMEQLENRLKKAQKIVEKTGGGILVITEGVFGMRGDTGRLDEIAALKEKYNARLFVDDAHGFGVMGETGIGTGEHYGVQDKIDVLFCTFAKSMAGFGAFVAGDEKVVRYLKYNMRSQIYAKSLCMPMTVGAIKRLEMLRTMPELRSNLWNIVNKLQNGLKERGFDIGDTQSPVTPVYLHGSEIEAIGVVADLRENHKIFASAVVYPVVEKGVIMLRLIPTAHHREEDVDYTLDAFDAVSKKLAEGVYKDPAFVGLLKQ